MPTILDDFCQFLDQSPTAWHAVRHIGSRWASLGVIPLEEGDKWVLEKKQRYFTVRGGSICGFALPPTAPQKMTIVAAHTDSPALKLKPNPEISTPPIQQLETEIYGGPLLSSWFNRDLAIAGRLVVENNQGDIEEKLVFLDDTPVFIPQLAIHLDREVNDKGPVIDKQDHLRPILSLQGGQSDQFLPLLKKYTSFKELLAFDLFLVPLEKTRRLGVSSEMLASYRLDNLASTHACATAFASAPLQDSLQISILYDAEEIGSRTADGAASTFLYDILRRIAAFYGLSEEDFIRLKSASLCISVDVAHAYNPNFVKKHDPQHHLMPGQGIAVKYNADKKYVTDATTAAPIISVCKKNSLRFQSFASHSNVSSGSTIGPIVAYSLGIPTADIGSPIFSMHSAREVMAVQDHLDMCQLLTVLLQQ